MYTEISPEEVLSAPGEEDILERPWSVRWDSAPAELDVLAELPAVVDLTTSGSTGSARTWRRTREQLWNEAGLLADLLAPYRPEALLAFAPPRHIYGFLTTLLVPARLGIPVWYRPSFFGEMPPPEGRRWAVTAIPWVFSLLNRRPEWAGETAGLTVLHSTATLPSTASEVLRGISPDRARIIEVFGSTETGGVATRVWDGAGKPWTLMEDVEFDFGSPAADDEVELAVRSPRLAAPPEGPWPVSTVLDDLVTPEGDRHFRFAGRRHRLVKVNGRRFDLDELGEQLRASRSCEDAVCVPVTDPLIGEHFDVLLVPRDGSSGDDQQTRSALARLQVRPRRVHVVEGIDRTETGKVRRLT